MKEYIEREAVLIYAKMLVHTAYERKEKITDDEIEKLVYGIHADFTGAELGAIPAADVVEVRTGRWILNTVRDEWQQFHSDPECSECGFHPYYYHDHSVMKYCPNCGAKMDGGADDDDN